MKKILKAMSKGLLFVNTAFFISVSNSLPPTPDEGSPDDNEKQSKLCNSLPPAPEKPARIIKAQNSLPPTPDFIYQEGLCNSLPPAPEKPARIIKAQNSLPPTPDFIYQEGLCNSLPPAPEKHVITRQSAFALYRIQQRQHTRV